MTAHSDLLAARHDIHHARAQISETVAELEARITAPVVAAKRRLDVGQMVQDHPWAAVAAAVSTGALVAASGADTRAASLAAERARAGAAAGMRLAREGGEAGLRLAREAPSKSRAAVGAALDAIGVKLALALVDALREPPSRG